MKKRKNDRQLDLFDWAENRPSAKIISALPRLERKLQAEMYRTDFTQPESVVLALPVAERRTA